MLNDIRCVYDTPKEFYDELIRASLAGEFPATALDGECQYLTCNQKRCGVGMLFSKEDAGRLRNGRVGGVRFNKQLFKDILPSWLSVEDAMQLQQLHDTYVSKGCNGDWSHEQWVAGLNKLGVFHDAA